MLSGCPQLEIEEIKKFLVLEGTFEKENVEIAGPTAVPASGHASTE